MKVSLGTLLLAAIAAGASAQVPAAGQQPPAVPGAGAVAAPPAPSSTATRTFAAPVGLLFNTVRPDKAVDFERLVANVRKTLESSTDPKLQAMAKGWRFYKASEPGPANSVLYVAIVDPTVPGEDYGLGRVLSSGSTDTAALQEIWKLYTNSVTAGGSLVNLSPIPEPPAETPGATKPAAPATAKP